MIITKITNIGIIFVSSEFPGVLNITEIRNSRPD